MGLCGCIRGSKNRIQQDSDEKKPYLGPRGYEITFSSAQDVDLHAYFWPADGSLQGVVQLLHGNNTYTEFDFLRSKEPGQPHSYEGSWVEELNQRGFLVCGFDFQGFGRSKGTRAYLQRFDDLVEDALLFARRVRSGSDGQPATEGVPHFLLGYGMGGLVAVAASLRQPGWFAGLLLVSPLLILPIDVREASGGIRFRNRLAPRSGVAVASDDVPKDWNKDICEQDPLLCTDKVRAATVVSLLDAAERLAAEEGDPPGFNCVSVPLLVFQASSDLISEPGGAMQLVQRAATHEKKLRPVTGSCHALLKDDAHSSELLAEAAAWLGKQCRTERTKGLFPRAPASDLSAGTGKGGKGDAEDEDEGEGEGEESPDRAAEVVMGAASAGAGALPGTVDFGGEPQRKSLGGVSAASGTAGAEFQPNLAPSFSGGVRGDDADRGEGNEAAARMAAMAAGDEDDVFDSSRRHVQGGGRDAEPQPRNPSQLSRRSSGASNPAREVDEEDGFGGGRGVDRRGSGDSSRGRDGFGRSPYGRGADDDDDRGPFRTNSAEREAARRWNDAGEDSSKDFFTAYGGSRRGLPPRSGSGDGDNDPFANPPSPGPAAPAHPPSSLPPIGTSRFAPLPPIGYGR